MRKILLYILFAAFFAGLATLTFGFYNGKKVRSWASAAREIKSAHDSYAKTKNIEANFQESRREAAEKLESEFESFATNLDSIFKETETASRKMKDLGGPAAVKSVQDEIADYYNLSSQQTRDLLGIIQFMNQLFDIAVIFDRMKENTTLEEIQKMISDARKENDEIDAKALPEDVKELGISLKESTDKLLATMEQTALGVVEDSNQLNESYADFSQKEDDFFLGARRYINSFQNLDPMGRKIDEDLAVLERVKFSLK